MAEVSMQFTAKLTKEVKFLPLSLRRKQPRKLHRPQLFRHRWHFMLRAT